MLWSLTVFWRSSNRAQEKTADDFASFSNELNDVEEIIFFKEAKMVREEGKMLIIINDVDVLWSMSFPHVDGRCLGPAEINDRHPLRSLRLSFALSFWKKERKKLSFSFSFLNNPRTNFIFLGFHILWKGAPILDDEVGGASEKCKRKEN